MVELERLLFGIGKEGPFLWQKTSAAVFDLKGSIRPFGRIWAACNRSVVTLSPIVLNVKGQPTSFGFDHVFDPGACNQEIFVELRLHVRSLPDQRNVCLIGYSKFHKIQTRTLFGTKKEELGVLFLLVRDCLWLVHTVFYRHKPLGKLTISSLSIYGDNFRDCLTGQDIRTRSLLQQVPFSDIRQGKKLLDQALENRQRHTQSPSHFGVHLTFALDINFKFTVVDLANNSEESRSGHNSMVDALTDLKEVRPDDLHSLYLVLDDMARTGKATNSRDSTVRCLIDTSYAHKC